MNKVLLITPGRPGSSAKPLVRGRNMVITQCPLYFLKQTSVSRSTRRLLVTQSGYRKPHVSGTSLQRRVNSS
jgi:hypothetical protein